MVCIAIGGALYVNHEAYKDVGLWLMVTLSSILALLKDIRSSKRLPDFDGKQDTVDTMKKIITFALLGTLVVMGCRTLQPGADPFVVRTEQALKTADSTFNFVFRVEDSNYTFWQQNSPKFVEFCEKLKVPTQYQVETLPLASVMILQVNDLKNAYKANKTASGSNALYTALLTLQSAATQATAWSNIVVDWNR